MAKSRSRKLADLLSNSNEQLDSAAIASGSVDTAELADDAVTAAKIEDNAVGADALNVSGNGTSGQVLQSDGDGSFSWADISAGNFQSVETPVADVVITANDTGTAYCVKNDIKLTLPSAEEGLVYAVVNEQTIDLLVASTGSQKIGGISSAIFIPPLKSSIFIGKSNSEWLVVGEAFTSLKLTELSGTGLFTPDPKTQSMLVTVTGATGGANAPAVGNVGGRGGAGYAEKYYATVSGTYNYAVGGRGSAGSAGGVTTFDNMTANSGAGSNGSGSAGGNASGGDINASGGSGGNGHQSWTNGWNYQARGAGGASGSRAGDGGNASNIQGTNSSGASGGTGGDASGTTGGPAANAPLPNAFDLSPYVTGTGTFRAGGNGGGSQGPSGANSDQTFAETFLDFERTQQLVIAGGGGGGYGPANPVNGSAGVIKVLEFF